MASNIIGLGRESVIVNLHSLAEGETKGDMARHRFLSRKKEQLRRGIRVLLAYNLVPGPFACPDVTKVPGEKFD